jgi:hypothetical protein
MWRFRPPGPAPFLRFLYGELRSTAPDHCLESTAVIYALSEVTALWDVGRRECPPRFLVRPRFKQPSLTFHAHVDVEHCSISFCGGCLHCCQQVADTMILDGARSIYK